VRLTRAVSVNRFAHTRWALGLFQPPDSLIYYATRESPEYLRACHQIAENDEPHDLVSVIGGMSFLHAVGDGTRSLKLVDNSKEQVEYALNILRLINEAKSLADFQRAVEEAMPPPRRLLGWILPASPRNPIVHFSHSPSQPLKHFHFYWNFGFGNFASERAFAKLQANLRRLRPSVVVGDLSSEAVGTDGPLCVLTSNCDQPLYTKGETVFRNIIQQTKRKMVYLAWSGRKLRRIELNVEDPHADAVKKVSRFTEGKTVDEIKTFAGHSFSHVELKATGYTRFSFEEFLARFRDGSNSTGSQCLLYHISLREPSPTQLRDFYLTAIDRYERIVHFDWQRLSKPEQVIALLKDMGFHYSFSVGGLDWSGKNPDEKDLLGRSYILVWDKRFS
jgi:hypothetical protein